MVKSQLGKFSFCDVKFSLYNVKFLTNLRNETSHCIIGDISLCKVVSLHKVFFAVFPKGEKGFLDHRSLIIAKYVDMEPNRELEVLLELQQLMVRYGM